MPTQTRTFGTLVHRDGSTVHFFMHTHTHTHTYTRVKKDTQPHHFCFASPVSSIHPYPSLASVVRPAHFLPFSLSLWVLAKIPLALASLILYLSPFLSLSISLSLSIALYYSSAPCKAFLLRGSFTAEFRPSRTTRFFGFPFFVGTLSGCLIMYAP